jgi:hypothetical protein
MSAPSNQAKSIFLTAIDEYAPVKWPAFLDRSCAGDLDLHPHGSWRVLPLSSGDARPDVSRGVPAQPVNFQQPIGLPRNDAAGGGTVGAGRDVTGSGGGGPFTSDSPEKRTYSRPLTLVSVQSPPILNKMSGTLDTEVLENSEAAPREAFGIGGLI